MPKTTSWREVRAQRPPNEAAVAREQLQLRLAILREQLGMNQTEMAERLGTSQPNVSQLERSEDLQLSSVAKYVHALGGRLEVSAVMGPTTVQLINDVSESLFRVLVYEGKRRPSYVSSFGLFTSADEAWAAAELQGLPTFPTDGKWAVVLP